MQHLLINAMRNGLLLSPTVCVALCAYNYGHNMPNTHIHMLKMRLSVRINTLEAYRYGGFHILVA